MEFSTGDIVVDASHGVGKITNIVTKTIAGVDQVFYNLQVGTLTILVPVDGASRVGLRRVVSKQEAKKVVDELTKAETAVKGGAWAKRVRRYNELLNTGSLVDVARVLRDLRKSTATKGEINPTEKGLIERARLRLVSELALAQGTSEDRVATRIDELTLHA